VHAVLAGADVFNFPLRRLGHRSSHGLFHRLAWHALWRPSVGSILLWIVLLAAVVLVVRLVRRRRSSRDWNGPSDRF
jgi:cytochrome c biogenesis factor